MQVAHLFIRELKFMHLKCDTETGDFLNIRRRVSRQNQGFREVERKRGVYKAEINAE